ncbi:PAS domain-containing protein, partial [Tamlana crocina]
FGHDAEYFLNYKPDIFRHFIHPDDYDLRMQNLTRCQSLAEEEECEVEVRFRAPKNQWEWYRIRERIFQQDREGKVTHVLGIAQNIHEQKIAEEKLREEHRRLEHAQQIGHIGSFERKLPGDIMDCSLEFYNIFGIE